MRKWCFGYFLLLTVSGCHFNGEDHLDAFTLKWFDKSYTKLLQKVSLKQLHLEQNRFEGRHLLITGKVESIGNQGTYFVLRENSRKLLILQYTITHVPWRIQAGDEQKTVMVMGQLSSQKKGLPALLAQVIIPQKHPSP